MSVTGWVLLAPAVLLVLALVVYPLVGVILRSFDPQGALSLADPGLNNYREMAAEPANRIILRNTFVIAAVAAVVTVVIAYPVAAFLSRLPGRRAQLLMLFVLFPFWTSVLVRIYSLQLLMSGADLLFTEAAAAIGMVSYLLPYLILIFYGGMVRIDDGLMTAARTLGAGPGQAVRRIFVPLTRPAVYSGALLAFVIGLGFFLTPALLGGPSNITVSMYIQQQVTIGNWGVAAAMGVGLLVLALVIYYVFDRAFGMDALAGAGDRGPVNVQVAPRPGGRRRVSVGRAALAGWSALVFAFLVVPLVYVVLVSFSPKSYLTFPPSGLSLQWYEELFADTAWGESAWLSFQVAVLATVLATVAGLLAALGMTRARPRGARALRGLFMLPMIVPVVLIAAGLYDLEGQLGIAGTVLGYGLAHAVLALPFTVLICTAALQQVGSSLEEAARSLGAGRVTAFCRVTLPLVLPSVAGAAVIAFITSWDEAVISLFLQVIEPTLPVKIYQFVQQDLRPTVAALSTLILAALVLIGGGALAVRAVRRSASGGSR
ncbi:ABC transporter permease subunit [Pseudonocardia acaciae]|uniref:ABC transporter permease subunit n=1 Tax=Pseudonocardia acaciae TaxID=551276 RepID=UPI00048B96F8|nr:ABC transporter permease subunit [Pseudonocardia acaciae]